VNEGQPKPPRFSVPTVSTIPGAAFLSGGGESGWAPPPLYLPKPLLILRVTDGETRVETPDGVVIARTPDQVVTAFHWMEEILAALADDAGRSERRLFLRPTFPLGVVCAAYEYGRRFTPHEHCFPHAEALEGDELAIAFHTLGFARVGKQWKLAGRPPTRQARWRTWTPAPRDLEWPPPPEIPTDSSSRKVKQSVLDQAFYRTPSIGTTWDDYQRKIAAIHRRLREGSIYQANLTVRLEGETPATAEKVFGEGLAAGGERFAALVRVPGQTHISFSPELFVRRFGRNISTHPIKGTRPRPPGSDVEQIERELLESAKDGAEHVMIVDLERNDLGRICEYGSVKVDPFRKPSRHATVVHLESCVSGILRADVGWREIFTALFPGGSVTGAPKRRAMEVIGELEGCARGIYCGALGWIDARGDGEMNLPIRTGTLHDDGRIHLHSGGGIVADSRAEEEWMEMQDKARLLQDAVRISSGAA